MSENFTREGKKANRNYLNNNNNNNNSKNLKDNNEFSNHCDGIFAQLTDMFGDVITSDVILSVCNKNEWDLTTCIENLIQESTDQQPANSDDTSKNINQIKNNCKITGNELLLSNSNYNNNVIDSNDLELLKVSNDIAAENAEIDVVIESEEQILDIAKRESINDTNNVNLGAIKKQLTQKTSPMENIKSNSSALKPFNFSSLLKQGDNHLFNLSNTQDTTMQQKTNKTKNIPKSPNYEKIVHLIKQGIKIMIIMRGAPGSGKSFLAKKVIDDTVKEPYRNHIFSSDDYFYDAHDRYCYNPDKLSDAHSYNQKLVSKKCHEGWSPIIVDNTNIQLWEMFPYIDFAAQYGYFIEILEPQTPWANSPRQLAQKNSHGVPENKIDKMLNNYEKINVSNLLKIRQLEFHLNISPQLRRYPIINPKVDNNEVINVQVKNNNNSSVEMETQSDIVDGDNPVLAEQRSAISLISDKVPIIPQLQMKREWNEDWIDPANEDKKTDTEDVGNAPKPPRKMKHTNSDSLKEEATKKVNSDVDDVIEISNKYNLIDWKAHDQEMQDFWSKANVPDLEDKNISHKKELPTPKSQRTLQKKSTNIGQSTSSSNMGGYLFGPDGAQSQDSRAVQQTFVGIQTVPNAVPLEKHKIGCENENKSFSQIRQIYPTVPIEYLWDLFENCQGDGNWTMDILLKDESKLAEYSTPSNNNNNLKNFNCGCSQINIDLISFDDLPRAITVPDVKTAQSPRHTSSSAPKNATPLQPSSSSPNITNPKTNNRKDKAILSEDKLNAKRAIEEKIMLGDEHYSEHMKKVRDLRHGVSTTVGSGMVDTELGASYNGAQSDVDTQSNDDTESSETDNDELVEVSLGTEFVAQLDNMFGINAYPKNTLKSMKTNVFMSKGLAKQLYALWMESIYNQIEEQRHKSLKEDEEFARQLQSKEKYPKLFKEPTNFKEIMDMEYAWAAYKAEIDEWKVTTPETLASRLSKQKLQHIFPSIEKEVLEQVLSAHNNKFDETVNTLKNSVDCHINEEMLAEGNELFEQARKEIEKPDESYPIKRSSSAGSTPSLDPKKLAPDEAKRLALIDFEDCRNNAMHHDQLKSECYAKANSAIQRGETSVALYYSQVAKLHKNKVDMYNQKAANCIMEVHSLTQNNPDIVDLHYLRVSEAVECLDIFLDKHINKLKSSPQNTKHLHIITGRGLHSARGIPTVKLKVKNRLKERNLKCMEINPGLLKVKIFPNSKLSQV